VSPAARSSGIVLVAVLLLTAATWLLLASLLTTAFVHHRLSLGAERAAVAGAAAERAVATYLDAADQARRLGQPWPSPVEPPDVGACSLDLVETGAGAGWWRVRVLGVFEGASAWREGTVHAPP